MVLWLSKVLFVWFAKCMALNQHGMSMVQAIHVAPGEIQTHPRNHVSGFGVKVIFRVEKLCCHGPWDSQGYLQIFLVPWLEDPPRRRSHRKGKMPCKNGRLLLGHLYRNNPLSKFRNQQSLQEIIPDLPYCNDFSSLFWFGCVPSLSLTSIFQGHVNFQGVQPLRYPGIHHKSHWWRDHWWNRSQVAQSQNHLWWFGFVWRFVLFY